MQNTIVALVFIGVNIVIVILFKYKKITNYPSLGRTVVAFGDSLIKGKGSTEGHDFVSLLSKEIGEPIVNLGVCGNTSAQGLARIQEVINLNPRVVLVLFGGNDFLREVPQEETFKNIDTIIKILQADGAVVVLLGIEGGILSDPFAKEFERLAKLRGALYVPDVLRGLIGNDDLMSDQVHPNDIGYKKLADRVLPVLKMGL